MPVPLLIETRLDERSATAAADKVQRMFSDVGKKAGGDFSKGLSGGLSDSEAGLRRVENTARNAYDKMRDAAGRLRTEEEKLADLRSKGAGNTRLIAQAEAVERARRAESRAVRDATGALQDYDAFAGRAANRMSALMNFTQGLGVGMGSFSSSAATATAAVGGLSASLGAGTAGLVGGIGAVVVGAGFATKALYDMGAQWDDIGDRIAVRTGLVGTNLKSMTDMVKDIGADTAAPMEKIGDVAGRVHQSLHLTGDAAKDMTQRIAELGALTGQDIDVRGLSEMFAVSGVGPGRMAGALNEVITVSQATGIEINELVGILRKTSSVTEEFGLSFQENAAMVATFQKAGVDLVKVAPSMSKALKGFAADGREPVAALQETITEIKRLSNTGRDFEAVTLAAETFGKSYAEVLGGIKDGTIDVQSFNTALGDNGDVLKRLVTETSDWHEEWQKLTNTLRSGFEPVAQSVFSQLNEWLTGPSRLVRDLGEAWDALTGSIERSNVATGQAMTQLSQAVPLELANQLRSMATDLNSVMFPGTQTGPGPQGPMDYKALYPLRGPGDSRFSLYPHGLPGTPQDRGPEKGAAAKLPEAPVLPLQYTQLGAGTPSAIVSAQTRLDEAAHTLAEKQARLTQLQSNNVATAADIQKAQNDVTEADRSNMQAVQALEDTKLRLFEQQSKQLKTQASQLGEIGASIDQDFGISKGLAGIAENITKFVANLAAAPLLGGLRGAQAGLGYAPGETGSGLVGMLASSGAFGSQYQILPQWMRATQGQSAMGPAAPQPQLGAVTGSQGTPTEDQVKQIAAQFGLRVTSEDRPGDRGYHGKGMALDIGNGDKTAQERAFAEYMFQNFGSNLLELIHDQPGFTSNIKDGKNVGKFGDFYTMGQAGYHGDHVHIAAQWGKATAPMQTGLAANTAAVSANTAALSGKQQIADYIGQKASAAGYSPAEAQAFIAQGLGESGLSASAYGATTGNASGGASGIFQFTPDTWQDFGQGGNPMNARENIDAYFRLAQARDPRTGSMRSRLGTISVGGPAVPSNNAPWDTYMQQAGGLMGGGAGAGGAFPGLSGPPQAISGAISPSLGQGGGPGTGPTLIGGAAPPVGKGSGFGGISGGLLGLAESAAKSAISAAGLAGDAAGGGGGGSAGAAVANAALEIGIKEINRAVGYVGQVVGIGAGGLMETFLPAGASELAANSWVSRIMGGLVGMQPVLPNLAGGGEKAAQGLTPEQQAQQAQGPLSPEQAAAHHANQASGVPQKPGDTNITVNNQRATEDGTGRDIAWMQQQTNAGPGM